MIGFAVPTSSLNVLIVDDDPLGRKLLTRSLENLGFGVIGCRDGLEALQILETGGPALLVLDYQMPELNGAQICELVRSHPNPEVAQTPIILLTAHSGEDQEIECLNAGADDFVTKPVNAAVLRARIDTHLRLHAMRRLLQDQKDELGSWREAHEQDLDRARLTQLALLPQRTPDLERWAVAAHYEPLIQVGGDIYDYQRLGNGSLLIWVADATGHGASAALLTTLTKLLFRHAIAENTTAQDIVRSVNRDLFGVFKGQSFMSAMCLVLSDDSEEIDLCGAGHPPAALLRKNGDREFLESAGPPIGLARELEIECSCATLEPGDALCLYTDGLLTPKKVATRNVTEDLRDVFQGGLPDPETFIAQSLDRARRESRDGKFTDDVTLVTAFRR